MFSVQQFLFPHKIDIDDLMSVRLMSESTIKLQSNEWRAKAFVCCVMAGMMLATIFTLSDTLLDHVNKPGALTVLGVSLMLFVSISLFGVAMGVLVSLCCLGVHEKLGVVSGSFKLSGVNYSACGYANILMEKIKECSGKVYKDDVISQSREFTRMDLWALENIYKAEQKNAECKALYLK